MFGSVHGLGATPEPLHAFYIPPRGQRPVSLAAPLNGLADQIVLRPSFHIRREPDPAMLNLLSGRNANVGARRLGVYDCTWNQPAQDVERETTYGTGYCKPASLRLPPILGKREMQH